ncbi:aminomethyl transferase family protein [Acetobacterium malicum]|uniref:Aminomethyl transferase family protein n=1 Tax=Acetobacterium malicum TaxID=52692 RepID=A0ABR6Z0F8_9FIRM|nr:aminomethyl transferase family protein [Acetobacterium malicum]MBC3900904.1 aminomethyl transferase family protein [Acetobacterium malicum]
MLDSINRDAFTLFNQGGNLIPYEYSGYKNEILASKSTAWFGTTLNSSPIYDVKGPDAAKFLSSICINSFFKMKPGSIRHAVLCNERGFILTDGVVMMIAENHFRTYWLNPVVGYYVSVTDMDVEGVDLSGKEFFFQLAGPKSLEILEQAAQSDLHDIAFTKHRMAKIAGVDVRILRLGMAGTLGYEIHGDAANTEAVYDCIWEVAQTFDAKKLGQVAYTMNHTEAGFPNINMHYPLPWFETPGLQEYLTERPMEGFFNLSRILVGSVGDDLESRFVTPYDVGWEYLIKFDHDFIGKAALEEIAKNPKRTMVTLEWNPDDLGEIFASQFRGQEVEPFESMDDRPMDMYYNSGFSMYYHADKVLAEGKEVGISSGRLNSYYYQRMISLAFIKPEYAVEGKELKVVWGTPGKPQKEIRVTVARSPYMNLENNKEIDVNEIPRYQR